MTCVLCAGRGLIRVNYQSGEPFDLAMCRCEKGQNLRRGGERFVRELFSVSEAVHRIAALEDFDDEEPMTPDFTAAAMRPQPRPKL